MPILLWAAIGFMTHLIMFLIGCIVGNFPHESEILSSNQFVPKGGTTFNDPIVPEDAFKDSSDIAEFIKKTQV